MSFIKSEDSFLEYQWKRQQWSNDERKSYLFRFPKIERVEMVLLPRF